MKYKLIVLWQDEFNLGSWFVLSVEGVTATDNFILETTNVFCP